jgi:hypothetical protein
VQKRSGSPRAMPSNAPAPLVLARSEMDAAGSALDLAMSLIEAAPRADKVAVSGALEQALERLRSARAALDLLEEPVDESSSVTTATG